MKDAGFWHTDIFVLFPAGGDTKELAVEKGTKAPEGAATGAKLAEPPITGEVC